MSLDLVLVGAGGIEPPNGGIKIHCLTAWLRPKKKGKRGIAAVFVRRNPPSLQL